mgnify:CR=1 FL=1
MKDLKQLKTCPVCKKKCKNLRSHFSAMYNIGKWTGRNSWFHKAHRYYWDLHYLYFYKK